MLFINISAIAGSDYITVSSSFVFTSGSTDNAARCVNITIIDDGALEGDQIFVVTLIPTATHDGLMLGIDRTCITITDNDGWLAVSELMNA